MAASIFDFFEARTKFNKLIHTSLSEESLAQNVTVLQQYPGSDSEKKATLDQTFRDVIRELGAADKGCTTYRVLLNLAVDAVMKDLCTNSVPFLMLSDIFDVIPLAECEDLFGFVEDKVNTWKSKDFYEAGKNYLLRMCNDILRRLSKSQNTVFCGRIQLFLSRLFPLSEKSALNLMSQFNYENATIYTIRAEPEVKVKVEVKEEKMEVEEGEMEEKHSGAPIDYNLYQKFWSLQDYFRKMSQCYDKTLWTTFVTNSDAVLTAFASSKLDDLKSSKKKLNERRNLNTDAFFAKYLTSEKLLDLQLNDSNFRRYVLVQFLILFQYLNSPVKFKQASYSLTDEQSSWVRSTTDTVFQLVRETPPDGDSFARTVENILAREESWNSWKNDGCPAYEKKVAKDGPKPIRKAKRRRIGDDLQSSGGKVIKMGNSELTKLWNLNPNNMNACKGEDRIFLPTLEEFFAEAIEQSDPEAQVEEQYKLTNEQTFQWRALRLLARRSPMFFTSSSSPAQSLNQYLNNSLTKLAKEMPSQASEEMHTEVGEDEEGIKETQDDDDIRDTPEQQGVGDGEPQGIVLNKAHLQEIVNRLRSADWKKLAMELSFPEDDIQFFDLEGKSASETALKMLTIWQENEGERATVAALRVALREVGMNEIAQDVLGGS